MRNLKFWIEKKCELCDKIFWSLKKRNQRFCNNKCSTNFTANDKNRIDKIKKTKLEKYGNESFVNPEKTKKTCIEKYGVDNVSKSDIIKNKIIEVNRKKYGVDYSWQNEEVKEKIRNTNLKKYGVENPSSSEIVKRNREETVYKKYGVFNVFQNKKILDKIINTNLDRYGVEFPRQSFQIKEKIIHSHRITIYNKNKQKFQHLVEFLFEFKDFKGIDKQYIYNFRCKKCNTIFKDHLDGNGHPRCLICFPYSQGFSFKEKEIIDFLKELMPYENIIERSRSIIKGLELDIYIPSKKIAIEFNGLYWHSEIGGNKDKNYHLNKTNACQNCGIRLIHIFEDEWVNNREIVENRLKHFLFKNNENKIHARKCEVKEIDRGTSSNFLNKYHLQGEDNSSIKFGAYYNNELVAVMTFGQLRRALGNRSKKNEYEMYRFATSKLVVGGSSRLLSHFIKTYNPFKIISYADKRWSNGNLYEKLEFKLISQTQPGYWYFRPGYPIRYHRFNFRKNVLKSKLEIFDEKLTEWENMKLNGYDRIWDCGNLKYEWVNEKYHPSSKFD